MIDMQRNISRALLCTIGLALATIVGAGCKPHYDGLEIRTLNGSDAFQDGVLEVEEGKAIVIEVEPISDNPHEDYENFDLVELVSFSPSVMLVAPSTDVDKFVLIGVSVGETSVEVSINDDDVDTLDARVIAQDAGGQ